MNKKKDKVLNLRISEELGKKIRELSNKKEISMNALIRTAIIEMLEKEK